MTGYDGIFISCVTAVIGFAIGVAVSQRHKEDAQADRNELSLYLLCAVLLFVLCKLPSWYDFDSTILKTGVYSVQTDSSSSKSVNPPASEVPAPTVQPVTEPPEASAAPAAPAPNEIPTASAVEKTYQMVFYQTREADTRYRIYHDYSMKDSLKENGMDEKYGEQTDRRIVTQAELDAAKRYEPTDKFFPDYDDGNKNGYIRANSPGYYFGDDHRVWFIEKVIG